MEVSLGEEGPTRSGDTDRAGGSAAERITSVLGGIGAIATVAGGILYGLLRLTYAEFYAQMSLAPEDVGLGAGRVLVDAAVPLALLLMIASGAVVLIPLIVLRSMRRRFPAIEGRFLSPLRGAYWTIVVILSALFIMEAGFLVFGGPGIAKHDGICVAAGYASSGESIAIRGMSDVTIGLSALPATVTSVSGELKANTAIGRLTPRRKPNLLLLGETSDQVVLWNPDEQTAIRLPESDVVVRTFDGDHVGHRPRVDSC